MVVIGSPQRISAESNFLDILDPIACFKQIPDYPISDLTHATGGVLENIPIICGGYSTEENWDDYTITRTYRDECFTLFEGNWVQETSMITPRVGAASVVINDTLWVTGGTEDHTLTTELVSLQRGQNLTEIVRGSLQ